MAQQEATVTETNQKAAQRLLAGEQLGAVLGLSELQVQGFAALGYNLYQQGQLKEAEKLFRGVTAFDSKSYLGYAGLGAVALATKPPDLDAAYTNLTKALELKPTTLRSRPTSEKFCFGRASSKKRRSIWSGLSSSIPDTTILAQTAPGPL